MSASEPPAGQKFKVLVCGRNYLMHLENGQAGKYGFYTTVFVEAPNSEDAKHIALQLLRSDSKLSTICKNSESDAPVLSIESADEVASFEGCTIPRTGLSLFEEK